MSVQEPAWLKRTRPCPFFSQGRCLFADSCNFLHDVKVRSAVNQPLRTTIQVKQLSLHTKSVLAPPSVVVNSASPRSATHNSETSDQDSSRYSGLLSVLSDVIGPPSDPSSTTGGVVPESRVISTNPSSLQNTAHARTSLPSEHSTSVASFESVHAVAEVETGTSASSSQVEPDSEATLVDPYGHHMDSFSPEELLFVPDERSGDTTAYFVEATDTYVIGLEDDDGEEGVDDRGEEDPTVMLSNRESTLSSFTGASLLATPRHSVSGEPSAANPIEDGAVDLLSPVQLSAKLRPFPIPSSTSRIKRGDSIDSGYADAGSWVDPLPFPRSPPRGSRSSVTFPSRSGRVSYDVGVLRTSIHNPIEAIREVEWDESSEDIEDTANTILGAYGTSPSAEQVEDQAAAPLEVSVLVEEDDELPEVSAVMRGLRRYAPEHLHPTNEHDLDSCNQLSFISDDNLSFKTALSTQPSYDDLCNISRVSPVKQDTLLSSISVCSTPNTSVLSHYGDANEFLEQSNVGSHVYGSPCLDSQQVDSTGNPEARPSEDGLFPLAGANDRQELAPGSLSDRHSPISSPPVNASRGLSPAKDVLDYVPLSPNDLCESVPEMVVIPRELSSGVFHFDKQPPKSSPTAERSDCPVDCALNPASSVANGHWEPGLENFAAPRERLPSGDFCFDEHTADISLGSDEVTGLSNPGCDSLTQRLSFPLPPPFLPVEIVGHSTFSGEDPSMLSETALNPEEDVSTPYGVSQEEEMERMHLSSDSTEKVLPSQLPLDGSPEPRTELTLRRSRAASDLTVKAESPPMIVPADTFDRLRSPLVPLEQPSRSDSVQSLYDQYFDDDSPDDGSDFSGPAGKDMAPPDVPNPDEERSQDDYFQALDLTPHVNQMVSALPDDVPEFGTSGADFPRSETVFRPLLTGRRSFLRSSLAELIPRADLANGKESSPTYSPTRVQVREIGSTLVPLGFRRYKPQPAVTYSPHPLYSVMPASELREVLRIRTDIAREDLPPGCSSASRVSSTTGSPLPAKAMSAPPTGGLRQLRLSSLISKRSSILSTHSSSIASSTLSSDQLFNASTPQSPSVSSTTSVSHNSLLSSSFAQIPEKPHHTLKRSSSDSLTLPADDGVCIELQTSLTHHDSPSVSVPAQQPKPWRLSHYRAGSRNYTSADGTRRISRRISTLSLPYAVDEEQEIDENDPTILCLVQSKLTDDWTRPASALAAAPVHAIATPKPNLLFAIASDDVDQVRQVLESGEAGPNDCVGPQSALAFTLTNDKLTRKQEIVKALLAYGANPSALRNPTLNPPPRKDESDEPSNPPRETTLEGMDPATRYFVARADAAHTRQTSQLIYRSFFRPLTRVRYDVIGQDWALEQLFRVLSIHSQKLAVAPIVVLLCGPSGHGKSLLARKFGFLLDVPTHTVNMTTLRSGHDIWQSYSMSPYEEPSSCTLAEFLIENEGKRCVVVLDEIEKVEDQKALWPLLMPWELGRCSLGAGKRHVDGRNVIWLGTSNVGHELVFEYHENRAEPDERMSREEYLELTGTLRPRVSHCLGASLLSRVTTVLPFVPFTLDEKKAIAAEAVYTLTGNASKTLSPQVVESLVTKSLPSYHPSEGARSLHRAISNLLIDAI